MKKIDRRKFLRLIGITAAAVSTSSFLCSNCAIASESDGKTRCPHRYCSRYQPPEGKINEKGYDLYTSKEGYCLSDAFEGQPRI